MTAAAQQPETAEPVMRTVKLRTSIAGTGIDGRPFAKGPGDTLTCPQPMAEALADGVRAVLLDDDGNELPVAERQAPAREGGRETATSKRARERETAQPPAGTPREDGPSGNEVDDRKRREQLEQLAEGDPVGDADANERARRTSRGRRRSGSSGGGDS